MIQGYIMACQFRFSWQANITEMKLLEAAKLVDAVLQADRTSSPKQAQYKL